MRTLYNILALILILTAPVFAADINLQWDPSEGATGYKIYKSLDLGVTWLTGTDVGNMTTFKILNVEENTLVLFRVSAYNQTGEAIRTEYGAWYDHRKKPPLNPTGLGIN